LATIRPLIYALFSENTHPDHAGSITGMQHFVGTFAEVIGILLFGFLSSAIGVQQTFLMVGIILFLLA
jgi:MFS family permease